MLIINADDLGYDPEIDRGIFEAHARGVVTSATAMVDTPFAAQALREAPRTLGLGLHAVLELHLDAAQTAREVERQIALFAQIRSAMPDHLDSHKHHHAAPLLLEGVARVAAARDLPVRALDDKMRSFLRARGVRTTDHFLGDAALRPCWTAERLAAALDGLGPGTTEIMCHPGYAPSHARTSFGVEREVELRACLDERVTAKAARAGLGRFLALPTSAPEASSK